MGKTGKWLRSFLTGKKDKEKEKYAADEDKKENSAAKENSTTSVVNPMTPLLIPPNTPKERRRWSFRRSSAASAAPKQSKATESITVLDPEEEQKKYAMVMAAAQAAAAVADDSGSSSETEEAAAIRIQSVFRSYLARKALCALKGLVKVQALVRGHLVRKQTTATLRCIQALVNAQNRAKVQRILMAEDVRPVSHRQLVHKKSSKENKIRHPNYEIGGDMEENIKIVEMDIGEIKGDTKNRSSYSKQDGFQVSPVPSASTDMGPKATSGHLEDYSFGTARSSPHYYSAASRLNPSRDTFAFPRPDSAEPMSYDYPLFPNYMANTESYRAKVRSHSAPKQRPDPFERQPSKRRTSAEGKIVPRALRMQRSSSEVGPAVQNCPYPWFIKLDRSSVSLKDSECGSTSTVLSNAHCCRSLVGFHAK